MLITAASRSIAVRIRSADREQEIRRGSGTFSARAPGQTPAMPTPFTGAAAIEAVAVPCESVTACSGSVAAAPRGAAPPHLPPGGAAAPPGRGPGARAAGGGVWGGGGAAPRGGGGADA